MQRARFLCWMWEKEENLDVDRVRELPLPIPLNYGLSRADLPSVSGEGAPFIGGSDAYWCPGQCWGVVSIRHGREQAQCPHCHGTVIYLARIMADIKEAEG